MYIMYCDIMYSKRNSLHFSVMCAVKFGEETHVNYVCCDSRRSQNTQVTDVKAVYGNEKEIQQVMPYLYT